MLSLPTPAVRVRTEQQACSFSYTGRYRYALLLLLLFFFCRSMRLLLPSFQLFTCTRLFFLPSSSLSLFTEVMFSFFFFFLFLLYRYSKYRQDILFFFFFHFLLQPSFRWSFLLFSSCFYSSVEEAVSFSSSFLSCFFFPWHIVTRCIFFPFLPSSDIFHNSLSDFLSSSSLLLLSLHRFQSKSTAVPARREMRLPRVLFSLR